MSYLQTFYYPYYSARSHRLSDLSLRQHQSIIQHQIQAQHLLRSDLHRQKQIKQILRNDLDNYARRIVVQDQLQRSRGERLGLINSLERERLRGVGVELERINRAEIEIDRAKQQQAQANYLDRIALLRKQRDLLQFNNRSFVPALDQRNMSDQQLIKRYGNGRRGEEYTQQLKSVIKSSNIDAIVQQQKGNKNETNGNVNVNGKGRLGKSSGSVDSGVVVNKNPQPGRNSYVDTLKTSKDFDPLKNTLSRSPIKGQTIDVVDYPKPSLHKPQTTYKSKHKSRKPSKIINKSIRKQSMKDNTYLGQINQILVSSAMQSKDVYIQRQKIDCRCRRLFIGILSYEESGMRLITCIILLSVSRE